MNSIVIVPYCESADWVCMRVSAKIEMMIALNSSFITIYIIAFVEIFDNRFHFIIYFIL